jgi:hypothetical protein
MAVPARVPAELDIEALMQEIARYLDAVALFRREGRDPWPNRPPRRPRTPVSGAALTTP